VLIIQIKRSLRGQGHQTSNISEK